MRPSIATEPSAEVTIDPGQNGPRSPKTLPKTDLTRKFKRKHKGQKVAPQLQVTDAGMAARARLYAQADSDYRDINHSWTVVWLRHRLKEYCEIHGYASAGVCASLERAAEQYADSDFLRATAASSGSKDIANALHQASRHAQLARSHELAAWELAAREGAAKKVHDGTGISGMSNRNGKLQAIIQEHPAYPGPDTGWGGVGPSGDPVPPFEAPQGVEGRGTISPSRSSKTKRPSSPLPLDAPPSYIAQPAAPKRPIYEYCEGCARNYREKVCPRCPAPETPAIVASEDAND